MIRKVSFAAFALLSCTAVAGAPDKRIRTMAYSSDQIVQILGRSGIQSTIEFAPDERIENVAVGDSAKWQITPNRRASLLFVKPLAPRSRTNMTVVTDHRTYMFDLVAGDKWTTPLYALKFSYPNEKPAAADAAKSVQQVAVAAPPPQVQAVMTAERLHFDWNSKGNAKLLPSRVFDDGSSLYLAWDKETPLPAILTMSEDRKEGPVNYRMSGEYIVIAPIPRNLVLRYGSKFAQLWPSHRVIPVAPNPANAAAERLAMRPTGSQPLPAPPTVSTPPPQPPAQAPASRAIGAVKVADVTTLYSDKLTDGRHGR
jgi:type IV secretion system protein VirB9